MDTAQKLALFIETFGDEDDFVDRADMHEHLGFYMLSIPNIRRATLDEAIKRVDAGMEDGSIQTDDDVRYLLIEMRDE